MLSEAKLPKMFWGDTILHAAHIVNRAPTRALKESITPFEAFTDERRQRFDPKSIECIHLGYAEHRKAYVCLQRSSGRIVESRDVVFDEGINGGSSRVKITADLNPSEIGQTHIEVIASAVEDEDSKIEQGQQVVPVQTYHPKIVQRPLQCTSTRCHAQPECPPGPYPRPVPGSYCGERGNS